MTGSIISVNNKRQPQTLSLSVSLAQAIYLLNTSAPVSGDGQYSYSFPQLPPRPTMTLKAGGTGVKGHMTWLCGWSLSAIPWWYHHY